MMSASLSTFEAFSPTPPSSSSARSSVASSQLWMPSCILATKCNLGDSLSVMKHLIKVHKAAHYMVAYDDHNVAHVELDTLVWLKESGTRRTALVLSLSGDGSVFAVSIDTRRRADGEIQISAVVQMLEPPRVISSSSCGSGVGGGGGGGDGGSSSGSQATKEEEGVRSRSSHNGTLSASSQLKRVNSSSSTCSSHSNSSSTSHVDYYCKWEETTTTRTTTTTTTTAADTTIIVEEDPQDDTTNNDNNNSCYYEICLYVQRGEEMEQRLERTLEITPSDHNFSRHHDRIVSHGHALVVLYPTHSDAFRPHEDGEGGALILPMQLSISRKVERVQ